MRLATVLLSALTVPLAVQAQSDWPAYGHDAGGSRFSPLTQIDSTNVQKLKLAWVYRTGDLMHMYSRFEATPILAGGVLYVSTPLGRVSALDPATGAERWSYDARVDLTRDYGDFANRGVSYWKDANGARVFLATVDARLIALDAATGKPVQSFGDSGTVDLVKGIGNPPAYPGEYEVTSPPAVIGDLLVVGSSISDNVRANAPSGVVRAYDARTGALRWSFDPFPAGPQTGAANAWSIISADPARDLVFVPVGSASPDFYGVDRPGEDHYANSVVALRASTGKMVWSFQVVHHDLWDYDVPAQPVVFTLHKNGHAFPALAVATKMGHLFILDRRNGKPLVPVVERPVPRSDIPGEVSSLTQPFPPPAYRFVPETLSSAQAFGVNPEGKAFCQAWMDSLRYQGIFTPSSLQGSIHFPGHIGGFNWSGVSVDEADGILVAPVNEIAMAVTLIPRDSLAAVRARHPDTEFGSQRGTPYASMRQNLLALNGPPCNAPPWGELVGFDLARDRVKWRVPNGAIPGLEGQHTGSPSLGGVLLTRGGLVFSGGTLDNRFRAYDITTGKVLWDSPLPVGGHALPATYAVGGRQYVVIAAGGHDRLHLGPPVLGDFVYAFALDSAEVEDTSRDVAGPWAGDLRIEDHERFPMTFSLTSARDSLIGQADVGAGAITGPISVYHPGLMVSWRLTFTYPAKSCSGEITGQGSEANQGSLLVGTLTVHSNCSDHDEPGTFSFRRAAARP
ncbi:MAG TPA: pyrroloquinoline quinone-dependent dehydrogenase [Gemmatimonadales bacterium]|nr:pyrroloquinoline quinone-dependent dehydrogenase [Gemmatimonadales bacterium]